MCKINFAKTVVLQLTAFWLANGASIVRPETALSTDADTSTEHPNSIELTSPIFETSFDVEHNYAGSPLELNTLNEATRHLLNIIKPLKAKIFDTGLTNTDLTGDLKDREDGVLVENSLRERKKLRLISRIKRNDRNTDFQVHEAMDYQNIKDNENRILQNPDAHKELEKALETHLEYFLNDMKVLFNYDLHKAIDNSKHRHRHHRKHQSRPKRNTQWRNLLKDLDVRRILKQYYEENANDGSGRQTLRYG